MAEAPDAPQRPTLRNKTLPFGPESDTAGCLRSYLPAAAAGLKPAERGPGGGLTATYCTQLCKRVRAKMQHLPHEMLTFMIRMGLLGSLGSLLQLLGGLLGASWVPRGGLWGPLGILLGASWGPLLGAILGPLGVSWEPLGAVLEASEALLGPSWKASIKKGGSPISPAPREPLKSPLGALLGRSWSALGRSWGRLGALLGPSWGPLGQYWSHLEASDGHRKRKGEKAENIEYL